MPKAQKILQFSTVTLSKDLRWLGKIRKKGSTPKTQGQLKPSFNSK